MLARFTHLFCNRIRHLLGRGPGQDAAAQAFVRTNEKKWPRLAPTDSVVLLGIFNWRPSICAYSYAANAFAARHHARIEAYYFGSGIDEETRRLYASFGASVTLGWENTRSHQTEARRLADSAFSGLRLKEDVFRIAFRDIVLGDLIYDSYLRYNYQPTVRLEDEALRQVIENAFLIALACAEYFAEHLVTTLLPYDAPYIESGIVHRFAVRHGVPIYAVEYNPLTLHRMDGEMRPGDLGDHRHWPLKVSNRQPSPEIFSLLRPVEQQLGLEKARRALAEKFEGRLASTFQASYNAPTAAHMNTFSATATEPVFENTGRPRILVMLSDFCDAPNVLRWALFPDFYEWLDFLSAQAARTEFDWYVKPHPNVHYDRRMNEANDRTIAELKQRHPHLRFISSRTSNRQILDEGINAMFTVYGSSAHEFAYHGVPVVNAGDNAHSEFDFNFHPTTREEYARLIQTADRLQLAIDRTEIEKFYYLFNFWPYDRLPSGISMLPAAWSGSPDMVRLEASTAVFRHYVEVDSPDRDRQIAAYIEAYLAAEAVPATPSTPALV